MTDRQQTIAGLASAIAEAEEPGIYSDDFRAWYGAYPRKRAPGRAWRAWKNIPARPALPVMLQALAWQVRSENWTRDDGKWIPYPESYLHGRQWEDEPPARAGYCPFHATRRNNGHPSPSPRDTCPECKHVSALRATRHSDAAGAAAAVEIFGAAVMEREPKWTAEGEGMLARDFAEAFPADPWPGRSEAWRRLSVKMRNERHGR